MARAHREGYAWQNWFSGGDRTSAATWRTLVDTCVDGIMTSQPEGAEKRVPRKAERSCASP